MGCGQEAAELRAIDKELAKAKGDAPYTEYRITDPSEPKPYFDFVNKPPHYTGGKVECIDAIEESTKNLTGIEAVCTGNIIKYVWRWKQKNGKQDLEKAKWYLQKLIDSL